jgi:hypothetical protein
MRLRRIHLPLLLLLFASLGACADPDTVETPDGLADGVYEVLAVEREREALPAERPDTRVLVHDHRYVQGGSEQAPDYVLLRLPGYAPLDLARPPAPGESEGRPVLLLNLEPAAGKALEDLTSRAEHAAVVIGGQVVTVHRIRVPIEGGMLQVSC